ncbi:TetR/AcrR family transcriptional regulator [Streptomyces sp. CS227]|uniref:TetR/AcrR family transcriptional regulator n=1 Tax=Streptomyces sp. CS227 TaxID=1982763 RepID=UPI00211AAEED|nr:hypothetical protein [Streptomyces sp. CS227]
MRRIAETAEVDQALVHHFNGTKEKLFLNALEIRLRMPEALAEAAAGDRVGLGSRIVLAHLRVWEDASARPAMMTTLRSAATHRSAAADLRDYATGTIREALGKVITGEDAEFRIALIATTLTGLSLTRHLVHLDPVPEVSLSPLRNWPPASAPSSTCTSTRWPRRPDRRHVSRETWRPHRTNRSRRSANTSRAHPGRRTGR